MKTSRLGNVPKNDGIDHINIHPKGRTPIGRLLTSYRSMNFIHPNHGPFRSIEGFMHYIRTGCKHDDLRSLYGYMAKTRGKSYRADTKYTKSEYQAEVLYAIYLKIRQNPKLLELLIESTLPFDSYYVFGPNNVIINTFDSEWLTDGITKIRKSLKCGLVPEVISGIIAKYEVS